jgi:P-type Ca2+ transporter type 2C
VAFVTWLLGHVFIALNLRSTRRSLVGLGPFSNRVIVGWDAVTLGIILCATLVPPVRLALKTTTLSGNQWALAVDAALLGTSWWEVGKLGLKAHRAKALL